MGTGKHGSPPFWMELQAHLAEQLVNIGKEESNHIKGIRRSIDLCADTLKLLKEGLSLYTFEEGEAIHFCKEIKPGFTGQMIFLTRMYAIEVGRPPGDKPTLEDYYKKELDRLKEYYEENRFMYRYLRSGATYLDDKLFSLDAGKQAIAMYGSDMPTDPNITHCYDHIIAGFKAAELLQEYLMTTLEHLQMPGQRPSANMPRITWTDSKTALIELAYALQSAGVFNNGKIDLKEVIDLLQTIFNINLGNYARTFQEILFRKTGYTHLLDRLKDKLLLRIKIIEDKHEP